MSHEPYEQYELPFVEDADPADVSGSPSTAQHDRIEEQAILTQAYEILARRHQHGETLSSPDHTKNFLRMRLADARNEVFGCIFLANRHRVIEVEDLFFGTIDGASVYPRVVVEKALEHNAAALIVYHNHPSGVADPSDADRRITERIRDALTLIDVRVIDHFIVSATDCTSFAERGLL